MSRRLRPLGPTRLLTPRRPAAAATAPPARPFNTHRALQRRGDSSPIDLCYFPTREAPATLDAVLPQIPLIPLTPSATRPARATDLVHGAAAVAAEEEEAALSNARVIATSSGVGVDEGTVLPMSESEGEGAPVRAATGESELRRVWTGFLDDLLGPRRGGGAAA